jgi:Tfp pilus assembly protein PilX
MAAEAGDAIVLSDLIGWLSRLAGGHALAAGWAILAGLVLLLAALSVGLMRLWPLSRRWAAANRLHNLANRNEASLRQGARRVAAGRTM